MSVKNEHADALKQLDEAKKKLEEARGNLSKITPQTGMSKKYYGDLFLAERELFRAEQRVDFYTIHLRSKKYEARKSYLEAFDRGESWPNPKEYEEYLINKRLKTASRNWNDRVPKLPSRSPSGKK